LSLRRSIQDVAIAVLNVDPMNDRLEQQTERMDESMPFFALDLLACLIAIGIDARRLFSALVRLWLAKMAARERASHPSRSRHST
jgi:hypothetical protein